MTYHNEVMQCVVVRVAVVHPYGPQGEAVAAWTLLDVDGRLEGACQGGELPRRGAIPGAGAGAPWGSHSLWDVLICRGNKGYGIRGYRYC